MARKSKPPESPASPVLETVVITAAAQPAMAPQPVRQPVQTPNPAPQPTVQAEVPAIPVPRYPLWRRVFFQPRVLFLLALAAVGGVTAPHWRGFAPDLGGRSEFRVGPDQVHVTPPPRWIPRNLVKEVFDQGRSDGILPESLSLLDDSLNATLADAFRAHPWVDEVRLVKKSFPATIQVELAYRQPVAMIEVPQGLYPVDIRSVLLPPADFSAAQAATYPLIQGVRSAPLGGPGSAWGDPVVLQSARLAATLGANWKTLQLEAIVCPKVSTSESPGVFTLASRGSHILWGKPPGTDDPGEPTTAQKVGRLEKYIADYGAFDRPRGPYEIDIRPFRVISRRPIIQNPTSYRMEDGERR